MHRIMKRIIKILCCHLIYKVKYIGLENLDNNKKYVICPSHSNIFDPTFIFPLVDNLNMMAKSELFQNKLFGKILKRYGTFPVDRKKVDIKSTFYAIESLKKENNSKLLIFPEGGIIKNDTQIRKKVKNGAVFIAQEAKVEILPVYITRKPQVFKEVYVVVGEPMKYPEKQKNNKEEIRKYSEILINKIYDLKEKIPVK